MMKHSIVALFSVLTNIVYGQFLGNWNHDLYGFRPYVAHSPSALSNSANLPVGAQQHGTDPQPEMRNLLVLTKLALLEKNYRKLEEELRTNLSDANQQIADLTNKLTSFNANITARVVDLEGKINGSTCTCDADSVTALAKMPTSCAELDQLGYRKSGLFSVMGTNQVETVYCDFTKNINDPAFQTLIGYQDVKSQPVYFSIKQFFTASSATLVPVFANGGLNLNIGNAMDDSTGIFTAPVKGIYFFSFIGSIKYQLGAQKPELAVSIIHDGSPVVTAQRSDKSTFAGDDSPIITVSIQATLWMLAGETAFVQVDRARNARLDDTEIPLRFHGWLAEQDFSA